LIIYEPKGEISKIISNNDKMFHDCIDPYLFVSQSAINAIIYALNMAEKTEVKTILDFPCGHGRVLRSLVQYFPDAEITACDLEKDAVNFCKDNFFARGIYSNTDISKIKLDRKFDLIWCGSLLTHFEKKLSEEFFNFFINHLEDDGLLVVSFHGRFSTNVVAQADSSPKTKKMLMHFRKREYAFFNADYHIDNDIAVPNYGGSFVKMSWVTSLIQKREDLTLIYFSERRYGKNQDVLAVQKKYIYNEI